MIRDDKEWQKFKNDIAHAQSVRARKAENFYKKHSNYKPNEIKDHLQGINFNRDVSKVRLKAGTVVIQYQQPGARQGNYYSMGADRSTLGLEGESARSKNRKPVAYILAKDCWALKSTSKDIEDWNRYGANGRAIHPSNRSKFEKGRFSGELFYGDGEQYFIPDKNSIQPIFKEQNRHVSTKEKNQQGMRVTAAQLAKSGKSEQQIRAELKQRYPDTAKKNPESLNRLAQQAYKGNQDRIAKEKDTPTRTGTQSSSNHQAVQTQQVGQEKQNRTQGGKATEQRQNSNHTQLQAQQKATQSQPKGRER